MQKAQLPATRLGRSVPHYVRAVLLIVDRVLEWREAAHAAWQKLVRSQLEVLAAARRRVAVTVVDLHLIRCLLALIADDEAFATQGARRRPRGARNHLDDRDDALGLLERDGPRRLMLDRLDDCALAQITQVGCVRCLHARGRAATASPSRVGRRGRKRCEPDAHVVVPTLQWRTGKFVDSVAQLDHLAVHVRTLPVVRAAVAAAAREGAAREGAAPRGDRTGTWDREAVVAVAALSHLARARCGAHGRRRREGKAADGAAVLVPSILRRR